MLWAPNTICYCIRIHKNNRIFSQIKPTASFRTSGNSTKYQPVIYLQKKEEKEHLCLSCMKVLWFHCFNQPSSIMLMQQRTNEVLQASLEPSSARDNQEKEQKQTIFLSTCTLTQQLAQCVFKEQKTNGPHSADWSQTWCSEGHQKKQLWKSLSF